MTIIDNKNIIYNIIQLITIIYNKIQLITIKIGIKKLKLGSSYKN